MKNKIEIFHVTTQLPSGIAELRNAIIAQAVRDWKNLCSGKTKPSAYANFEEILLFFRSYALDLLVDYKGIDSNRIIDYLFSIPNAPNRNNFIDG